MKYNEFREIMKKHVEKGQGIEVHEDDWSIMMAYITINEISICECSSIRIVDGDNSGVVVWFDRNAHINLEDIYELHIVPVRSYLHK